LQIKRLVYPIILLLLTLGLGGYFWGYFSKPLVSKGLRSPAANSPASEPLRTLTQESHWLNTSRPLLPEDLSGRILLVDFWTFCCINCMHVFPDLHALEKEFGADLTVIGVHSAKFDNEKETENIRSAVLRYGIEHPVVNDGEFKIWNGFSVNAWPTLVLLDPSGKVDRVYSGEGHLGELRQDISRLRKDFAGRLRSDPLALVLERNKTPPADLNFPGKLEFAEDLGLLFVSDSSNHRVLGMKLDGTVDFEVGKRGESGKADGDFSQARFQQPQGLLYRDGQLYVADTGNHLLRKIDLKSKQVSTLAGTGEQGLMRNPQAAPGLQTPLSSPWDLQFFPSVDEIAIAMAGTHQIWAYSLTQKTLRVLAGNGRESIDDGVYPHNSLSQPSGLAAWKDRLYFVDSETSSLRVLHGGKVETLLGSGLFDFGFVDGGKPEAKLQHPLGIFADDSGVYIADSYNHALRRYDPATGGLETLVGKGKPGKTEGGLAGLQLNEPNDVLNIGQTSYVADTNNQRLLALDFSRRAARPLAIQFPSPRPESKLASRLPNLHPTPAQILAAGGNIALQIHLDPGWKLNKQAPNWLKLFKTEGEAVSLEKSFAKQDLAEKNLFLPPLEEKKSFRLQGTLYFCREGQEALCYLQSVDQNLEVKATGVNSLEIVLKKDS